MTQLYQADLNLITSLVTSGGKVVKQTGEYTLVEVNYITACESFSTVTVIVVPVGASNSVIEHEVGHIRLGHIKDFVKRGVDEDTVEKLLEIELEADAMVSIDNLRDLYGVLKGCKKDLGLYGEYIRVLRIGAVLNRMGWQTTR
jgi:hypothetical protein